ncbi:hypothetical protein [Streptomyces apocyni]|uniref:hypothetical protein n=1 Tax=Streptomyces apocyni TaxID=2654677 RepID=UPI0012EAD1AC|nr:hypothetical protein [Streptomyces apocyni]
MTATALAEREPGRNFKQLTEDLDRLDSDPPHWLLAGETDSGAAESHICRGID